MGISEEKAALRTRYRQERNARYIEHSFEFLANSREFQSASTIASYPFTDLSSIDLIIVPALRIDRSGYRLGQGGGFYDRALADIHAFSIGLIHPDEISSEDLPREPWDIPLNAAATPDLVLRFTR